MDIQNIDSYGELLSSLKERIRNAQIRATVAVNSEMMLLYWEIGQDILSRQQREGWGTKVIDRLSHDLSLEFPNMKGFSPRSLKYMRKFAEIYQDSSIVQQPVAQLSWGHNVVLMDKIDDPEERLWYARQSLEHGWSRNILVHQIESHLYKRQVLSEKTTNFKATLPPPQSDLAEQMIKDPYIFDFLSLGKEAQERELEQALTEHITRFLLELGTGFAFVGRQYHLEVSGKDFYVDLLFYHLKLRCYIAIELKIGEFEPEYAGQINFYLSALDDLVRHPDDKPSIGIILCKTKDRVIAEYALRDTRKPIGVSVYQLSHVIPEELEKVLPAPDELERELTKS